MSKTKTKLNVKLLRKIQKHILAEPKRLDMGCFIDHEGDGNPIRKKFPVCGTVGCIAGWAVSLSTKEKVGYGAIAARAQRFLGLDWAEASSLFYEDNWPPDLHRQLLLTNPQTLPHAKITAKRIDLLIKAKGAENFR